MARFSVSQALAASGVVSATVILGCNASAEKATPAASASAVPGAASGGGDKRWEKFEQTNKRDASVAASAYERRQAQLAEKRRKAKGKTDAPGAKPKTDAP